MKKIFQKKKYKYLLGFLIILVGFGLSYSLCLAADVNNVKDVASNKNWFDSTLGNFITMIVGMLASLIVAVVGLLITVLVNILIGVAQFNQIVSQPVVIDGWVVIRDICNMFFVVILLVIAFGTILKVNNNVYSLKTLPKLLLMAVLINFSRTIFGLIIDASQVVMLTFVVAFSEGGGHFINMFMVDRWLSKGDADGSQWGVIMAMIAGVIAAVITLIVLGVMLAILVVRIVMLWIYTILSPLILLGFAFQPLQKYTGQLWQDFIKYVTVGPILAFFIWLALLTASTNVNDQTTLYTEAQAEASGAASVCVGASKFFCSGDLSKFLMVIAFLMGGMMIASQTSGAAGKIAGKGLAMAKSWGTGIVKGSAKMGGLVAAGGLGLGAMGIGKGLGALGKKSTGRAAGLAKKAGTFLENAGGIGTGLSKDMWTARTKRLKDARKKLLEKAGVGKEAGAAIDKTLGTGAGQGVANAIGGAAAVLGITMSLVSGPVGWAAGAAALATGAAIGGGATYGGLKLKEKGEKNIVGGNPVRGRVQKFIGEGIAGLMSKTTKEAGGDIAKDAKVADQNWKNLTPILNDPKDPTKGRGRSYNDILSVSAAQMTKEFFVRGSEMDDDTVEACAKAARDIEAVGNNPTRTNADIANVEKIAKKLASFEKSGGDASAYSDVKKAIDFTSGKVGRPNDLETYSYYQGSAVPLRSSGKVGEQGSGQVNVLGLHDFAYEESNTLHVPFDRMEGFKSKMQSLPPGQGMKPEELATAEGYYANDPAMVKSILTDSLAYHQSELGRLKSLKPDEIGADKPIRSEGERDYLIGATEQAIARLQTMQTQENPGSLRLVNSSSRNYGEVEQGITENHETMHDYGAGDERLMRELDLRVPPAMPYDIKDDVLRDVASAAKAREGSITDANAGQHADEIMQEVFAKYAERLDSISQAAAKGGGVVRRSDLSVADQEVLGRKVEEHAFAHDKKAEEYEELAVNAAPNSNARREAAEKAREQHEQARALREQESFSASEGPLKEVADDLERKKAQVGSQADKVIAAENVGLPREDTEAVAADRKAEEAERKVVVEIPEMEGFQKALADFKDGAGKVGAGGVDFNKITQLLTALNYNMFQVYKLLVKQSMAGGPIKEMISGKDANGEEKDKVPLDIAVISQAVEDEVKKA
jgi:hypothetical protein